MGLFLAWFATAVVTLGCGFAIGYDRGHNHGEAEGYDKGFDHGYALGGEHARTE